MEFRCLRDFPILRESSAGRGAAGEFSSSPAAFCGGRVFSVSRCTLGVVSASETSFVIFSLQGAGHS